MRKRFEIHSGGGITTVTVNFSLKGEKEATIEIIHRVWDETCQKEVTLKDTYTVSMWERHIIYLILHILEAMGAEKVDDEEEKEG